MLWIGIVLFLMAVLVLTFLWGVRRLRRSIGQVTQEIGKVSMRDIERLREECRQVVKTSFGEELSLEDFDASASLLSRRIDDQSLKKAFSKDDFWWYFVLPVGAFVGELMRRHAGGQWHASPGGGLEMRLPLAEGEATTYPFDKVLKQHTSGDKSDLYAYLKTACQLEVAMAQSANTAA